MVLESSKSEGQYLHCSASWELDLPREFSDKKEYRSEVNLGTVKSGFTIKKFYSHNVDEKYFVKVNIAMSFKILSNSHFFYNLVIPKRDLFRN